jgi:putative sterol carrier protein
LSDKRLKENERYVKHLENVRGMKEISEREEVPLGRAERKKLMKSDRRYRELDEGDEDDEEQSERRRKRNERPKDDVVLDAAYDILMDIIRMKEGEEMPKPKRWWE